MQFRNIRDSFSIPADELANVLTHGIGLLLSIGGFFVLLGLAFLYGDVWHVLSSTIYGITLIVLYGASTFYHGVTDPALKRKLRLLDHIAIYLLIAGSYTPFALVLLRQDGGWGLFLIIWSLAALGMLFKLTLTFRFPIISTVIYLGMGWLVVLYAVPLFENLPPTGLFWVILGGFFYTVGVPFYASSRLKQGHALWHIFVLLGSLCHFLAISMYVLL